MSTRFSLDDTFIEEGLDLTVHMVLPLVQGIQNYVVRVGSLESFYYDMRSEEQLATLEQTNLQAI
ncbi:hypothetical protein LIS04_155 [Listeria phage LIS04]|nr:hypothetical protein LIS04_155 [Listeria phage LIS04]